MSHNEKRQAWYIEGIYNLITGTTYGAASIIVGHPMDTVKTKLQAQTSFLHNATLTSTTRSIYKTEGLRGFYKGALPPLLGSIVFRSLQFSVFESVYTYLQNTEKTLKTIPHTMGLQYRVVIAGVTASLARAVVESPFEYAKVKRQTAQQWDLRQVYKGFLALYVRTTVLMTTFFIGLDSFRRNTDVYNWYGGSFIVASCSATFAWALVWPFENLKNQIQAGTKGVGETWLARFGWMVRTHGFRGLYRGMLPGMICVSTRNGAAMASMQFCNRKMSEYGWRK